MYQIMIVDDEQYILEGIKEVIEQADLPFNEVRIVSSSKEALRLFRNNPYDIILTDISMPEMDGLQFIEETRKIWKDTVVIFLTGYQYFSYAKKAIQLGGVEYLLKPVSDEELLDVLRREIKNLDDCWYQRFFTKNRDSSNDQLKKEQQLLLEKWFHTCIKNNGCSPDLLQNKFMECKIPLSLEKENSLILVDYGYDESQNREHITGQWNIRSVHHQFMSILQTALYGDFMLEGFLVNRRFSLFIAQRIMNDYTGKDAGLLKTVQEMQSYYIENTDHVVSVSVASEVTWGALPAFAKKQIERMEQLNSKGEFFYISGSSDDKLPLYSDVDSGDEKDFFIIKIKKYIKQYPEKDLSLTELSSRFKINPSYLSRIFHKEAKKSLTEYILDVRMNKAEELLVHTNMRVSEISKKVGFNNSGYFTRIFSEYMGRSPTIYRKENLNPNKK